MVAAKVVFGKKISLEMLMESDSKVSDFNQYVFPLWKK